MDNNKPTYEQLQERLREVEEKAVFFEFIAENTFDWEEYRDTTWNKLLFVNKAFERITGFNKEDYLSGKIAIKDFVHPDYLEKSYLEIQNAINQKTITDFNLKIIRKDKSERDISLSAQPVYIDNKFVGVRSSLRDITDYALIKKLEKALNEVEESEEKFKTIFNQSGVSKLLIDSENSNILDANSTAVKVYGYSKEQLTRMSLFDLIVPSSVDIKVDLKDVSQYQNKIFRRQHYNANREIIDVEVYASPIKIKGKLVISSIIIDVTEQNKFRDQLIAAKQLAEENEKKFRTIFEKSKVINILINSDNGNIIDINDAACSFYGYSKDKLLTLNIADINGIIKDELARTLEYLIREKNVVHYRRHIKSNGEIVDVQVFTSVIKIHNKLVIYSTVYDITESNRIKNELIKAKEEAEENETKYRELVENLDEGIWLTDENSFTIFVNPKMAEILGYTQDEMIGQHFYSFMDDEGKNIANIYTSNSQLGFQEKHDFQFIHRSGRKIFCMLNSIPIFRNNAYKGTLAAVVDISDRIKIENEVKTSLEKAEESDRLKSAFLQNMSHEIRTPMNAIIGFSDMLEKPDLSEEKRKSFISIIINSAHQLLAIVNDILTISSIDTKQQKTNITEVCVNDIIVELLTIFKKQVINQNVSIYAKKQLSDIRSVIYTDKTKLNEMLTNLISNALKFTHQGFVEFGYQLKNSELEFYVKDSGIGIKPELSEHIFGRFQQADPTISKKYGGTGLGLSISKAFAELLGGKIWVESEPDKGSVFYFTIPYNPVHKEEKSDKKNNKTVILVAEDEEYNYLLIQELLNQMNVNLIHAKNGKEALEICNSNNHIGLVLMDIKMPVMDGFTSAKLIKEVRPELPIIAQSAYALEDEIKEYRQVFDHYFTKPVKRAEFTTVVQNFISLA